MQIHVCGQRGVWSTVDVPEGEVVVLRETLRDLEDNTQAIRLKIGGEIPVESKDETPAPAPTPEPAPVEQTEPKTEG